MIELSTGLLRSSVIRTKIRCKKGVPIMPVLSVVRELFLSRADGLFFKETALSRKEETKMKRNLAITAALALLATTAASAQTVNVKATVPFSFIVGRVT